MKIIADPMFNSCMYVISSSFYEFSFPSSFLFALPSYRSSAHSPFSILFSRFQILGNVLHFMRRLPLSIFDILFFFFYQRPKILFLGLKFQSEMCRFSNVLNIDIRVHIFIVFNKRPLFSLLCHKFRIRFPKKFFASSRNIILIKRKRFDAVSSFRWQLNGPVLLM